MAFTREDLATYEKGPQKEVSDKVNPFRGATPAKAADAAAVAAVAAGNIDATPGGAPAAARAVPDPLADDSPVVDEDGTLGDPTDSGEGTSDAQSEESSASAVDPGDETDPNVDLVAEQPAEEEADARPAAKKGSAAERIVELNDLAEGYKVFGSHMQEQLKDALAEINRLKGGTPTAGPVAAPPVVEDEPMPDMADEDVGFDNDKYRAKMQKWVKGQVRSGTAAAVREINGAGVADKMRQDVETKVSTFVKDHPDFDHVVVKNPTLAAHQLAPDAGLAVAQSEYTAELLYKFGKDTGLAVRVAKLSPAQQLVAIGRMIAEIESEKNVTTAKKQETTQGGAKPAQKKSHTQAPPPPRAIPAAGRPAGRSQLDPAMDMNEFARQHRAGKQSSREANRKQRGLN
jgi:hypothetical protein